jgi:hypothetical protein
MSRSPEALASGPAVISFRRRYHCPSAGAFLTGLATAVGPASRRFQRRRYADAPAAASFSACASLRRDLTVTGWGTKLEARSDMG